MVLLAEYQAPPPVDEIRFGNSLALRPRLPRARRGPAPRSKPFDAAEIYHTDSQLADITQWRITALLEGLKRILTWEDEGVVSDRTTRIERIRLELERRGLDFEKLVRFGLAMKISVAVQATAIASRVIGGFDDSASPMGKRVHAWIPSLGLEHLKPVESADLPQAVIAAFSAHRIFRIKRWVKTASLEDIIDLIPPGRDLSEYQIVDDDVSCENKYQWLIDRFTTTYLWEWKLSSMKLEWKYQHGLLTPLCGNPDMATVPIGENDLAKQIAAHSIEDDEESHTPGLSAAVYVPVALSLLNAGRREEAAAIFEATASLFPRDPFALNNWAFCLMPDSPERALELLDRASQNGLNDNLMLVGNRLWCLLRLNRHSTALSVADAIVGSLAARPVQTAHMWSIESDSVEEVNDLRSYVLDLIACVVRNSADEAISERWKLLLDDVRGAISRR